MRGLAPVPDSAQSRILQNGLLCGPRTQAPEQQGMACHPIHTQLLDLLGKLLSSHPGESKSDVC